MLAFLPPITQLITALVALCALFISPRLSFQMSRRLALSQMRQVWLDSLRNDVAELLALHEQLVADRTNAKLRRMPDPDDSNALTRTARLLLQVRSKIDPTNADQLALVEALGAYICVYDLEAPEFSKEPVLTALDAIGRAAWAEIKVGKF